LQARLDTDPADIEAAEGLADLAAADGDFERAFDLLLDAIRNNSGEQRERARVHIVKLLNTLPLDDPRATAARRSLSLALY
jgi:putative thioredoxin